MRMIKQQNQANYRNILETQKQQQKGSVDPAYPFSRVELKSNYRDPGSISKSIPVSSNVTQLNRYQDHRPHEEGAMPPAGVRRMPKF